MSSTLQKVVFEGKTFEYNPEMLSDYITVVNNSVYSVMYITHHSMLKLLRERKECEILPLTQHSVDRLVKDNTKNMDILFSVRGWKDENSDAFFIKHETC
jgi:phosphohistidine phosphatase SixA